MIEDSRQLPRQSATTRALMTRAADLGSLLCDYMPGSIDGEHWVKSRCDCKFGASGKGEQNGCAEMRLVYRMLRRRDDEPAMGNGGPCMSCDGNDGYGPAPHHKPDCYFASAEDAGEVAPGA